MNRNEILIQNALLVLPNDVLNGHLLLRDGKIAAIVPANQQPPSLSSAAQVWDANGMYVLPGMIEMHSDAIEKEIQPRPNSIFPLEIAMASLEKKMAGYGVTMLYHSICSSDGTAVRNDETVGRIIRFAARKRNEPSLIRHRIHYRYEITNIPGIQLVRDLLNENQIDLLSFMDHTPGQGQYGDRETYRSYLVDTENLTEAEADSILEELIQYQKKVDWEQVKQLAAYAVSKGVAIASHDDDSQAKVDYMKEIGVGISEFPVNLETAAYAKEKGLYVSVGAPNVVRGGSHNKNMRAMDAIEADSVHILCSDYYPASLLPSVFQVAEAIGSLPQAVRMVTLHPAEALGIEAEFGSLDEGKIADLIFVEKSNGYPFVRKSLVGGSLVQEVNFFPKPAVKITAS